MDPGLDVLRSWVRPRLRYAGQGLLLALLAATAHVTLFVLSVVALVCTVLGVGLYAVPAVTAAVRRLADLNRRLAGAWTGVEVPAPYRPLPAGAGVWRRYGWVVTDPATWRDLLWLLLAMPVNLVLGVLPSALLLYGVEGVVGVPLLLWRLGAWYGYGVIWPIDGAFDALLTVPQGALIALLGLLVGDHVRWLQACVVRALLGPTRGAALRQRVQQLTESRAETVDAQAAELRRIERDLHDGAQARLVALRMSIGLAEQLMTRDPEAAQKLLAEARETSARALGELRDLVRGIHPPVLAERGLDGAVRALAVALPIPVEVDVDLPGRPPAPVESAAYFAVAESVANLTKHSRARHAWVRLRHDRGRLTMVVADDGVGGADPSAGTGLRGIERRLAAFDGTVSVTSPPGGGTTVTMELPCELSSPRTSPSSGTG
ncbi:sensor histidine kinase [Micromonospora sp. HM5-17]|jgi:signal transduction histidine kinase|uniref:sensor histidine kinase n=1 Tax=Micromonospora sp. HM5-17 TaxID=2487710 RepID=UPI000F477D54|nr:sensor histidine kinase [Micromonospora sp. HM5-17]ROT28151.1 sensor histidine kinase [Micromonospora sp. HM5-17]